MNTPNRDGRPTIAEVAALPRRLRELSAQGRDADPAGRAEFLAEKDALLARIAAGPESDQALHQHRAQLDRTDGPDDVVFDADDSQWWHPGGSARLDLPHPDVLPPWAQLAPGPVPAELAARAASLCEQAGVVGASTGTECERQMPWSTAVDGSEVEARREQLARWHEDAPAAEPDTETFGLMDPPYGDSGWSR